jgi:UDP-N-acetylmuramoyl-tripeptide--D-alanyl-D-alanine ligase
MTLEELYTIFQEKGLTVSTDTRTIVPGSIFFALRGENFDGGKFIDEALQKGASFIVSENPDVPLDRSVFVKDSTKALSDFARLYRNDLPIPVIAITGSNGKTTTKELVRVVLGKKYKVLASPASFNNHIGVPMTILAISPEHQIAVIEMGDNHEGEITNLCSIAQPTHGLITNIGRDHIGEAGGMEANIRAKLELYDYFRNKGGTNFLNKEGELLLSHSRELTNELYIDGVVLESDGFLKIKIDGEEVKTKCIGDYNLDNFRAAFTLGKFFGVPTHDIISALEQYEPKNNRSQKVVTEKNEIILDAYNANPDSMRFSLESFAKIKTEKEKIAILGDMFELGKFAQEEHQKILDLIARLDLRAYFAGEEFLKLKKDESIFKTTEELIEHLKQNKIENSLILIKGSRGMKMEKVLEENLL